MIKISPSLLAANFANIGEDVKKIESYADMLHIDVMDGHFVPNISFGVPAVSGIKNATKLMLDVHLMIENPLSYIEKFAKAGADLITVHIEAPDDASECIKLIESLGIKTGIALNPDTPPQKIEHLADRVDMVLQMTVFPGFGGQSMVTQALDNIGIIRQMIGPEKDLQVDGGIYVQNCAEITALGANVIVSGTGIFGQADSVKAIQQLKEQAIKGAGL